MRRIMEIITYMLTMCVFSVRVAAEVQEVEPTADTSWKENMTLKLDRLLVGYDRRLRPGFGEKPLVIKTDILVRSMGPVSERSMDYSMDCYFRQLWIDKRLALNITLPNVSLNIKVLERLWYPDTIFLNGGKSYVHTVPMPNKFVRINKDGSVLYSQRLTIRASCRMHLEKYPLDSQNCPLHVGSFAYNVEEVIYEWRFGSGKSVEIETGMTLSQFDLLKTPSYNRTEMFKGASHSILGVHYFLRRHMDHFLINVYVPRWLLVVLSWVSFWMFFLAPHSILSVHFFLRRHMGYFLINVYVPCCLLVVLSWVSFWINREATSDRIALGTTTVLTMTFIGLDNRNDLPRVSYSTALDVYVAMCFVFVLATILQFACVHYFTKFGCGEEPHLVTYVPRKVPLQDVYETEETTSYKDSTKKNGQSGDSDWGQEGSPQHKKGHSSESALFKCWNCFFGTRNIHNNRIVTENVFGLNSVSKIDKISRVTFPAVFTVFNIFYWSIYLADDVILY